MDTMPVYRRDMRISRQLFNYIATLTGKLFLFTLLTTKSIYRQASRKLQDWKVNFSVKVLTRLI